MSGHRSRTVHVSIGKYAPPSHFTYDAQHWLVKEMIMLALIDTHNLRDTGVACTEFPGPSPASIERGLKSSFARMTF